MSERLGRRVIRNITIVSDLLLINLAFAFSYVVRYQFQWLLPTSYVDPYISYVPQQILLTVLLIVTFAQNKVWKRRRGEFWIDELSRVGYATAAGIALMVAFTFFVRPLSYSRLLLIWALIFIVVFVGTARGLRRLILMALYRRGILVDRAMVVGSGEVGRSVIRTLIARPDLGFEPIGYLQGGDEQDSIGSARVPNLGFWSQLETMLDEHPELHTVFVALPTRLHHHVEHMVRSCQQRDIRAQVVPDLFQLSLNRVEFNNMAGIPVFNARDVSLSRSGEIAKRVMDLTISVLLGIPVLMVTGVIAAAIKLESPGPAFFHQERIGQHGKPFRMVKFRSMIVDAEDRKAALEEMNEAEGPIFKIRKDPRTTRVGGLIRRMSLDELPQLFNVVKGEMSLVGPRPPLASEVANYQDWHHQRLEVRGGLSGLWQVSGRSDLTFDEQCLLDIYYIENWSLALDMRIILQTIPHSLFGRGAY